MPKLARLQGRGAKLMQRGKLQPLNMRTTAEIRGRLEEAAALSGRSLTQEVERRLEQSFDPRPTLEDQLKQRYGAQAAGLLLLLGRELIGRVSMAGGPGCDIHTEWLDNPKAAASVALFLRLALKVLGAEETSQAELQSLTDRFGWGWLVALADPSPFGEQKFVHDALSALFGSTATERAAKRLGMFKGERAAVEAASPEAAG